ncbi:helix-turn-helix domain-containing protein [Dyadobacter sp. NIV53]|uniref:AraC family transcriptional regulator n=1 Tax=Dyadobacter sp. NIV53 TaxID=2861765 RepID=UPI001E53886B|nr:helix-turn-helix domain-containing protein [Dyadobacter sp. NIV53]
MVLNQTLNIRKLYMPVQPTVSKSAEQVLYTEFLPDELLQNHILCYWELKTCQPLNAPFTYQVVADGCIDIYFDLTDPRENFVMGFCKNYTEFPLENEFHYVGVRFLPAMFPVLFKVNASELSNRWEYLNVVLPETASFISQEFYNEMTSEQIKTVFDQYFNQILSQSVTEPDPRLLNAVSIILENFGVLHVESDLDVGVSVRQLRRLFEFYIGSSAKTFSQVVRFQNILRAKPSQQSLRENKLVFDAGYYDQAHFIKEFKNFYGVTPSRAFGR